MLRVQNITKSFGGVQAIQGSTFEIQEGKVTALIGPNGAGKTTLFDIISGLLVPDTGDIIFGEHNVTSLAAHDRARLGISRTFQQVRLFKYLTIADHLAMTTGYDDERLIHNLFLKKKTHVAYQAILDQFGIERDPDALVSELSYGQRKLLELVMALQMPHQLLLLDEPVAGVNKVLQEKIEAMLLQLKEQKETMLVIDHDMAFIRTLADHVVVLDAGVVVVEGTPDKVLQDPRVLEAYLGE